MHCSLFFYNTHNLLFGSTNSPELTIAFYFINNGNTENTLNYNTATYQNNTGKSHKQQNVLHGNVSVNITEVRIMKSDSGYLQLLFNLLNVSFDKFSV